MPKFPFQATPDSLPSASPSERGRKAAVLVPPAAAPNGSQGGAHPDLLGRPASPCALPYSSLEQCQRRDTTGQDSLDVTSEAGRSSGCAGQGFHFQTGCAGLGQWALQLVCREGMSVRGERRCGLREARGLCRLTSQLARGLAAQLADFL